MNYFYYFWALVFLIFGITQLAKVYKRSRYNPEVGDILCRNSSVNNPFDRLELEILAVKDGWVQYRFHPAHRNSSTYSDSLSNIREYYTKIN